MRRLDDVLIGDNNTKIQYVIPDATRNLITNPSVENDLTGWVVDGASMERTQEAARFGGYSIKVTPLSDTPDRGVYFTIAPNTTETVYTASVYVMAEDAGDVRLILKDETNGDTFQSDVVSLRSDRWRRVSVIGSTGGAPCLDLRLYVVTEFGRTYNFYVDGAMIEENPHPTTYCDGDQPGCHWDIIAHATESYRDTDARGGGRIVETPDELVLTVTGGLGMLPVRTVAEDVVLRPGAYFQRQRVLPRVVTLNYHAKDNRLTQRKCDESLIRLNQLRQELINLVRPDQAKGNQAFVMRYVTGQVPLELEVRYDGGLNFDHDIRNYAVNSMVMRLMSHEQPFWREDSQYVQVLDNFKEVALTKLQGDPSTCARINGEWVAVGTEGAVLNQTWQDLAFVEDTNGQVWIAVDIDSTVPIKNYLALYYWDGTNKLGTNARDIQANGGETIRDMAVNALGEVYIGGEFNAWQDGGANPPTNIVKYDPVADDYDAADIGFTGAGAVTGGNGIYAVAIDKNQDVWVGGDFTACGGVANTDRIARWDYQTGTWNSVSLNTDFQDGRINDILILDTDDIYVTGTFTKGGGSVGDYVAYYDGSTWQEVGVTGTGLGAEGIALAPDRNNRPVIVGDFTTAGGVTVNYICKWNLILFRRFETGLNATARDVAFDRSTGLIYVCGDFDEASGLALTDQFAIWNNSTWTHADFDRIPGVASITRVMVTRNSDIYILFDGTGTFQAAAINTVNNIGTAEVRPKIVIDGPGHVKYIENQTTESKLFFDLQVQDGERVTIDFSSETQPVVSTWRGNIPDAILESSDFAEFRLLPGDNKVATFMQLLSGETEIGTMQIQYIPQHWSVDGVAEQFGST